MPASSFAGVIALDGPSGTGKSTVARGLARRLRVRYLDSGAMYRAVTALGLLGISAAQASQGLSIWSILVFPALFTAGMTIIDTTDSILVDEQDHGLVFYVPVSDVRRELLVETDDHSTCPYKGDARYWRLVEGTEPIAWDYPEPYGEVERLRDHLAFYQDRVSVEIGIGARSGG